MIKLMKRLWFGLTYKRAVRKAIRLSSETGLRYYVIYLNKELKVVSKQRVKELVVKHRFIKGTKVTDIEKRALFITK